MLLPYQSTASTPIYKADKLLKTEAKQSIIKQIQQLFPKPDYQKLYLPIIQQFSEAVQSLPNYSKDILIDFGDLLECSLSRARYALSLALEYLFPNETNFYSLYSSTFKGLSKDKHTLELYAVFTAALFLDIHQLITEYHINLYGSEQSAFIKVWNPLINLMVEEEHAVSYHFQKSDQTLEHLPRLANGSLAISILSKNPKTKKGLAYLMSDLEIFEYWLGILAGEESRIVTNPVMSLIPFANKMLVDEQLLKKTPSNFRKGIFSQALNEASGDSSERVLGERFLKWLRNRIAMDEVPINQSRTAGVLRVEEGVLISKALLKQFSEQYDLDPQLVEKQFHQVVALYPSSINERARQSSALGGTAQAALEQWLVAYNPALVFGLSGRPTLYKGNLNQLNYPQNPLPTVPSLNH